MKKKHVKIVATLGPASSSAEMIEKLADEGVDVFRINLSHQKKEEIIEIVGRIRAAERRLSKPLAIMGDLAGPKIRIGNVADDTYLENNQVVEVCMEEVFGTHERFSINYPEIVQQLKEGTEIYIDDGLIKLVVEKEEENGVAVARVLVGGKLKPYKGFFGQGLYLSIEELSKKDAGDIKIMTEVDADALAISFVQSAKDVQRVRDVLPEKSSMLLIAKIETQGAIDNAEEILDAADGLMVARGDLGLGMPMEEVPHLQKKLISLALKKAKPVITATQMLESMTHNPLPTRAEVADVANAILDGTDAVMLSGETAVGSFPIDVIQMMAKIIESSSREVEIRHYSEEEHAANAVSNSAGLMADQIGAKVIVVFTETGLSARRISRYRHAQPIVTLSRQLKIMRELCFTWGVYPMLLIDDTTDFYHLLDQAKTVAVSSKVAHVVKGDQFVIVAGIPFNSPGSTNLLYVETL